MAKFCQQITKLWLIQKEIVLVRTKVAQSAMIQEIVQERLKILQRVASNEKK